MYLILTAAAAIVSTVVWYAKLPDTRYRIGFLSLMYWGATLMWTVRSSIRLSAHFYWGSLSFWQD